MEKFRASLDRALNNLFYSKGSLSKEGGLELDDLSSSLPKQFSVSKSSII